MIQFENHSLCYVFYKQLISSFHTSHYEDVTIFMEEDGEFMNLCLRFPPNSDDESFNKHIIATVLANVTIRVYLTDWIQQLVCDRFHYKDAYEISTITEIAKDIFMNNEKSEVNIGISFPNWQIEMIQLYEMFLKESLRFSFDSFLRFRLRKHREYLVEVVEKAIDEYKFEYDYQQMLETCRKHLKEHAPKVDIVHVYLDNQVFIADEEGDEIPISQIRKWLTDDLTFEYPLPLEERIISPLVAIAPKLVIVHMYRHDEGLIHTLMSIFEERIRFKEDYRFMDK